MIDGPSFIRLRWRLHGAWMWPSFIALTLLDALIVHVRPLAGDSESPVAGWLLGTFLGLVGIVIAAPLIGRLLRRARPDMPVVVARDYAGTGVIALITASFLAIGIAHHTQVSADARALEDAVARAEAYIGAHAPTPFATNLGSADTYEIQPDTIYRTCVISSTTGRSYCVVVRRDLPFSRSVTYAGSEPNQMLSQGTS